MPGGIVTGLVPVDCCIWVGSLPVHMRASRSKDVPEKARERGTQRGRGTIWSTTKWGDKVSDEVDDKGLPLLPP